jgi:hypothetical protein
MAAASMVAVLAEVAGAAVDGAAVGVELAGEVVVGGGVDRPSGLWASASVWDLRELMQAGTTVGVRGGAAATRVCAGGKSGLVGAGAWCP